MKFRAWDKDKKEMISVRSIHYDTTSKIIGCYCNKDQSGDKPIKNFELMQYTGLIDKNDKEIYVEDIVLVKVCGGTTYFMIPDEEQGRLYKGKVNDLFMGGFTFDNDDFFNTFNTLHFSDLNFDDTDEIEVIGNIYENPELTK